MCKVVEKTECVDCYVKVLLHSDGYSVLDYRPKTIASATNALIEGILSEDLAAAGVTLHQFFQNLLTRKCAAEGTGVEEMIMEFSWIAQWDS